MGRRLGRGFEHLTLADLSRQEKDSFATRWSELIDRPERRVAAAAELIADIHSSDRIERLTGNPMLLTTMALVKRKVGKLPQRRADLYGEAVQVLLNWRPEVGAPLSYQEAVPQLEYLSYAMCDRGVQRLREDEVIEYFQRMRLEFPNIHAVKARSPEAFLKILESRTGLLIQSGYIRHFGTSVPVYEFRHLTFQEYLAARGLVTGQIPDRDRNLSLAEIVAPLAGRTTTGSQGAQGLSEEITVVESWREAIRLCTAICHNDDVDSVLRAILTPRRGEPSGNPRARAIQAGMCLADEPNASEVVSTEIISALMDQLDARDKGMGTTALRVVMEELALTRWPTNLLDEMLARVLEDASYLPNFGLTVCGVVEATLRRDSADLASWLRDQVQHLQEGSERIAIEAALGVMCKAYEHGPEFHSNLPDLSRFGDVVDLAEALLRRLQGSAPMATAAAWALGWLHGRRAGGVAWKPTQVQVDALIDFVQCKNSDTEAVRYISWILGHEQVLAAARPLASRLEHSSTDLRRDLATALALIGGDFALGAARRCLRDNSIEVRTEALEYLSLQLKEFDRRLLLRYDPYQKLDPQEPIDLDFVRANAARLSLSEIEVRAHYELLAERFDLRLLWTPGLNPAS